jgi:hypothetical protein
MIWATWAVLIAMIVIHVIHVRNLRAFIRKVLDQNIEAGRAVQSMTKVLDDKTSECESLAISRRVLSIALEREMGRSKMLEVQLNAKTQIIKPGGKR